MESLYTDLKIVGVRKERSIDDDKRKINAVVRDISAAAQAQVLKKFRIMDDQRKFDNYAIQIRVKTEDVPKFMALDKCMLEETDTEMRVFKIEQSAIRTVPKVLHGTKNDELQEHLVRQASEVTV